MTGHPDDQAYVQWRGPVFASGNQVVTIAAPLTVDQYVTNYASLHIFASAVFGNGGIVTVTFFTDSTKTVQVDAFTWNVWSSSLQVTVPVLGNFAEFTITTRNAGNQSFMVFLAPCNIAVPRPVYPASFNEVNGLAISIGANVTTTYQLPQVVAGTAFVSLRDIAASGKFSVQLRDLDDQGNEVAELMFAGGFTGAVNVSSGSGERVLRLAVFNSDGAAAHTINFRVRTLSQ